MAADYTKIINIAPKNLHHYCLYKWALLQIARNLFRWTKDTKYMDYYERALMNGILGVQRGQQPGVMIYMLPMEPGSSKARSYHGWGKKFSSFWCCYGTGNFSTFSALNVSLVSFHRTFITFRFSMLWPSREAVAYEKFIEVS